jgi:alpha-L-rhamnosidase
MTSTTTPVTHVTAHATTAAPDGRPVAEPAAPVGLAVEHVRDPLGVGTARPRLSWHVPEAPADWVPDHAEVELLGRRPAPGGSSEPVTEAECATVDTPTGVLVAWPFSPLASREQATWRVRVHGHGHRSTPWSEPFTVEAAFLDRSDWTAEFVGAPWVENTRVDQAPPILRREVTLRRPVRAARLAVTSLGLHEVVVDGVKVGDAELAPGWSSYDNRLRTLTHDVTAHLGGTTDGAEPRLQSGSGGATDGAEPRLQSGSGGMTDGAEPRLQSGSGDAPDASRAPDVSDASDATDAADRTVVLGARLADGWFRGRLGWDDRVRNLYGDRLALLAQLDVEYTDGTTERFTTDDGWRAARGGILRSGIYDGERFDAGVEPTGWEQPGFDDSDWDAVTVLDAATGFADRELVAYDGPVVRVTEEIAPVSVTPHDGGSVQLDFGQNIAGRLRVRAKRTSPFGIRARHAEVMQDGELATRPLRTAEATDVYFSDPVDQDEASFWQPRFTVHGFRYAEIEGFPGPIEDGDVVAQVMHSDMRRTGWFHCSDPRLERLHENVVWSMRDNFVDVPTDCPQRDERLGWTGDLQVFTPTAAFLHDCSGVLQGWLHDLTAEQKPDGRVPHFVPEVPGIDPAADRAAIWGDVAVLTPWALHTAFGDLGVLEAQYETARGWVDGVHASSDEDLVVTEGFQFGDWLDPQAPPENAAAAKADAYCLATAYSYRSTSVLAEMAGLLGKSDDASRYSALASRIADSWRSRFLDDAGTLVDDSQASSAIAIVFGLVPASSAVGTRLAELVRENGHRIGTGFAGTPVICDALTDAGHLDDAYAMLLQDECPSWLYPVSQGATTIWERWDSLLPNGRVNSGGMTSFNHYALGSVADYMHRVVAGIAPAAPGYSRIRFQPRPGGGLTSAGAALDTPYGRAAIDWEVAGSDLTVTATVPVGATASLVLGASEEELGHGTWTVTVPVASV